MESRLQAECLHFHYDCACFFFFRSPAAPSPAGADSSAAALPVFAPGGLPGAARLFGPTGGFLLAYPLAAALAGIVTARGTGWVRVLAAPALGMLAIYAGGAAQLLVLTGSASLAVALGALPFVAGDLLKVGVAALVLRRFAGSTRTVRR